MIFETERLLVRELTTDDFAPYFEMQGNPNIHRYTCTPPDDEATARAGLQHHIQCYAKRDNDWWIWAIELKNSGEFVGTAAVIQGENEVVGDGPEIGYRFLEKHWGNGYATEICNPLIAHAFEKMQLKTLFAAVDILNEPSVKVLEKSELPFVKEYFNDKDQCTDRVYFLERD